MTNNTCLYICCHWSGYLHMKVVVAAHIPCNYLLAYTRTRGRSTRLSSLPVMLHTRKLALARFPE